MADLTLAQVQAESERFGRIAYVSTVSASGDPHVAPVAVAWIDDDLCAFVLATSSKVANLRANPAAMVHWSVGESTDWDSCMVWGSASIVDTAEGRTALWGRMGYDLGAFEAGGPESSNHVFVRIAPQKATVLRFYGIKGRDTWRA